MWPRRGVSPAVMRRAGLWLVARAASAAEAGVVLVTAELGLQDQVTVGQVWLVHALPAQVHDVVHSSCSQAKGEAAVNPPPGLSLAGVISLPKDTAYSCFLHPASSKDIGLNSVQHQG